MYVDFLIVGFTDPTIAYTVLFSVDPSEGLIPESIIDITVDSIAGSEANGTRVNYMRITPESPFPSETPIQYSNVSRGDVPS